MIGLLSPRLWLALGVAAALAFSHFTVYRAGKNHVRMEWAAATAVANQEAARLERARQSRVDDVVRLARTREDGLRADSVRAGDALGRLRDSINARRMAEESAAAATQRANRLGELLAESGEALREMASRCDRHVNDVRTLMDAWPK